MPKSFLSVLLIASIAFNTAFAQNQVKAPLVKLSVNWQDYLSRHDMVWKSMPADYFEGAFVGNGLLGTIIFKDNLQPNTLRFEIGRSDVYDHRSMDMPAAHYRGRIPIGQLLLTSAGEIISTNLRTDLWNAEIRGEIKTSKGVISLRCFVPTGEEVIVLNLSSTSNEKNSKCFFRPQQAVSSRYLEQPFRDKGFVYEANPRFTESIIDDVNVAIQPLAIGDDYATAWREKKHSDSTRTVMVAVANRWAVLHKAATGSAFDAVASIKKVEKKPIELIEKIHRNWWHSFYPKSFVTFPDPRLESFYWIQQYKLASATRPDKPVIDLMGPWYKTTVWPCLWLNLNVQLSYYTTGITNHIDLEDPLYRLIEKHQDQLIQNVPEEFRNDCSALGNPVGFDDMKAPVFLTTERKSDREMNIIVLPWLMQQFYLHNRRTMDDVRLRNSIYPLMKRAYNVYMRILYKGDDGLYHIPYTFSDEYGKANETSMNIALARWGFKTLIEVSNRLNINDPMLPKWKDRLSKMADYHMNENGIMIGKDVPFAKAHRHYSHMLGIFPFYETNLENYSDKIPMLKKTVQHFTNLEGDNCMYKFSGASSLWASLAEGNNALQMLKRSVEVYPRYGSIPKIPTCTPNTFYCERGNPTFESPISSSRSMLDMIIQSWGGVIRIFPAMPDVWKDAQFFQLRTAGAFLVSAKREDGKTKFLHIKSLAGEPCIIQSDLPLDVKIMGVPSNRLQHKNGKIILDLRKGEEAILYVGKKPASFVVEALPMAKEDMNQWGR
jgi:hypothetical protein